jgi:all-trans-retinol dehydrogenase (NAD+)
VGTWKILSHINSHISQRSLNNYEPDSTWDWSKEVILITGGSNGIGAVMARKFAERDIKVIIWDIEAPSPELSSKQSTLPPYIPSQTHARQQLTSPRPEHASIHYYPVDVTNDALISTTATTVRSTHGAPTILINNAGIALAGAFLTEPPAYTHRQFAINILAQMRLVQEFVPDMAARNHGHVVSMASASSFISSTALVSYASSKAAVMAMHEGVAQELRTRYHAPRVRMR